MLNILVIKQPKGCYINLEHRCYDTYIINGETPKPTFDSAWQFVSSEPKTVQKYEAQQNTNFRYILKDMSMLSDKLKESFLRTDIADYDSSAYDWIWKPEFANLQSLYRLESDKQPDILVDVEFTTNIIFETDHEAIPVEKFEYPAMKGSYNSDGLAQISNASLRRRLIDEIEVPSLYMGERPCKLASAQTYEIIRQHVKENINPKTAQVTSDFDFCFTVKKIIKLAVPEKYSVDINNTASFSKRKKKPIYEDRYRTAKSIEIFEMTSVEKAYKGYTPIPGITGKNDADIKAKMDAYLADLMEFINAPLEECTCCGGLGVVAAKKFDGELK